jgi:N-acetylmuramoyl-L-alanine amidase
MKINVFSSGEDKGTVVQMLQTIGYGDEAVVEYSNHNSFQLTTENITEASYLLISTIFLFVFFLSLYKITRLKKKFPKTKFEDISFIETDVKGTPFSFFKNIFWNKAIDIHSNSGQQIFNHEIAHIKEKHSHDKIFMNIVLIFFWINPFFWLIKKELYMIHEFIADKEALEDSDISAFAEMILQTVYPGQNFSIANNFFYSPLKRRLLMLTKNQNPKVSYISRLLVLPLAAIVFFAFTLKVKNNSANLYDGKTLTVIIDPGHGGEDNSAHSATGIKEKDINLSIAKKIADLNSNSHLKIVLTRNNDEYMAVKDKVIFAKDNNADLFISIHLNGAVNEQLNGISVLIDKNNSQKNLLLGSALISELKKSYKTDGQIGTRTHGVWVLDNNVCPAALINCGYVTNAADAAFISKSANQEKIAKDILDAINVYAASEENINDANHPGIDNALSTKSLKEDSIPNRALIIADGKNISKGEMQNIDPKDIQSINVLKSGKAIEKYGEKGKNGVIEITTKNTIGKVAIVETDAKRINGIPSDAVIIINGKESSKNDFKNIQPENIESVNILKGQTAINKYGNRAKAGAVEITTKDDIPGKALMYINGKESSKEEMDKIPSEKIESITVLKGEKAIEKYGNKAEYGVIEITTKPQVLYLKDTIPDKVFTKVENEASFPGGLQAWVKYISKAITDSISKFTEADYGTCVLRFIVNTDGSISDVVATTMRGTELAKVSINAIKNGPKWIPASQNGKTVAAYRLQPVTLTNPDKKPGSTEKETNKTSSASNNSADAIFTKLEQPASFPGGQTAWLKYITRAIQKNANELTADNNSQGSCKVRFIVSKDGRVSDVEAISKQNTRLADVAVNAIENGPRWIPGMQNGRVVNSFVIQPVSFALNDKADLKNEPE